MHPILIYVTCKNDEEAQEIAAALLEKNLIACANIRPPHKAVYKWEGQVESGEEVSMLMKTQQHLFPAIEKEICALHSYECPCIIALDIKAGHDPFLQWIEEQTA